MSVSAFRPFAPPTRAGLSICSCHGRCRHRDARFIDAPAYSLGTLGHRALPLAPVPRFRAMRLWWVRSCRESPRFALSRRPRRRVECPAKLKGFSGDCPPPPGPSGRSTAR